jgi:hypothetical protein
MASTWQRRALLHQRKTKDYFRQRKNDHLSGRGRHSLKGWREQTRVRRTSNVLRLGGRLRRTVVRVFGEVGLSPDRFGLSRASRRLAACSGKDKRQKIKAPQSHTTRNVKCFCSARHLLKGGHSASCLSRPKGLHGLVHFPLP